MLHHLLWCIMCGDVMYKREDKFEFLKPDTVVAFCKNFLYFLIKISWLIISWTKQSLNENTVHRKYPIRISTNLCNFRFKEVKNEKSQGAGFRKKIFTIFETHQLVRNTSLPPKHMPNNKWNFHFFLIQPLHLRMNRETDRKNGIFSTLENRFENNILS